jgi:hypothetical protein
MGTVRDWIARLRTTDARTASEAEPPAVEWRERPLNDGMRRIEHPIKLAEFDCMLSFSVEDERVVIHKITAEGHEGQGHMKPLLRELHRRHPRSTWVIDKDLTPDGNGFWAHIKPWAQEELAVTLDW